jgi:hypothetical protein
MIGNAHESREKSNMLGRKEMARGMRIFDNCGLESGMAGHLACNKLLGFKHE